VPLTLSHPAAVLPLRRLGLPMTVLVIGSMVPDIPPFLGSGRWYERTHSVLGLVTLDVAVTAVVVAVWFLVLRDALVDLAPAPVRGRIDWLQAEHAGLFGMKWAQYGSGVVGLAVVIMAALVHLRAAPAIRSAPDGLHAMAFNGVVDSLSVLACGLVLVCLGWHAARRRS
jgi:hypothetical protein